MDFGIARVSGSEHLTNAGFMMGTPAYMAPEQVMGADVDVRADLYAMGVVFYRLTTAKLPFKGETPFAMAQSQVNDPPTPVMLARPDLPTWVDALIARALAKAPKDRFQSAVEFHESFARSIAGLPALAPDDGSAPTELMTTPTRTPLATPYATAATPTMTQPSASGHVVVSVPAPAAPSPSKEANPRPARSNSGVAVLIAVAILVAVGLLARTWLGSGQGAPVEPPAAPPVSAPPATEAVPPPVPPPVADAIPPPVSPPAAAATSPATPGPPTVQAVPGRAGQARGAASSSSTPAGAVASAPGPPVNDTLAAFGGVKLIAVGANSRRGVERDVVINFGGGQISVLPRDGGAAIAAVPYQRIRRATLVNARDPKWDPTLAAPPADLDVGTVIRRARAWLVVQTADAYAILRLDTNAARIIETLEARTGIKVDRSR
jgi:hypothetical protein